MALGGDRRNGLALGLWGAISATAGGAAIAAGGARCAISSSHLAATGALGPALADPSAGYGAVYHVELALLFAGLATVGPLVRFPAQHPSAAPLRRSPRNPAEPRRAAMIPARLVHAISSTCRRSSSCCSCCSSSDSSITCARRTSARAIRSNRTGPTATGGRVSVVGFPPMPKPKTFLQQVRAAGAGAGSAPRARSDRAHGAGPRLPRRALRPDRRPARRRRRAGLLRAQGGGARPDVARIAPNIQPLRKLPEHRHRTQR